MGKHIMHATIFAILFFSLPAAASAQQFLHQPTDSASPVPIPASIRAELHDPFFKIVIDPRPDALSLKKVIDVLTEGGSSFTSFVVGEQIGRPETVIAHTNPRCGNQSIRRMVLSFSGTHAGTGLPLDSNIFISVFMTSAGPTGDLEVMGWDETSGTYNYYKTGPNGWRLRNRSSDLETRSAAVLSDGCLACHVNGGPIMKEFTFPWNHWHSMGTAFVAPYLQPGNPQSWRATEGRALKALGGAQVLEEHIASSLQRFAGRLINDKRAEAAGTVTISGLRGLLDSLFQPTELNLGSSIAISGLDGGGITKRNSNSMTIPDSFFVNVAQMRDIDLPVFAGQPRISKLFTPDSRGLSVEEYEALLNEYNIDTPCMPGKDTIFAWFGPEPSEFDRRMVQRLRRGGIIDRELIAAALAVDVGTPLFSPARRSLLKHVPEEVSAPNASALAEALKTKIVSNIEAVEEADRSDAEKDFLALLKSGDAVSELNRRVVALRDETQRALDPSNPAVRKQKLSELYGLLIKNRDAFKGSPISARLAEFPGLFPIKR